ncbi:AMP-binding protein [Catenulispora sp. NF23]|uniref:AMP-binding protein n=1 Tax=Catenulispora pinistramenti TaxID=2705254 RepID=A0ABS5KH23_9ACTN|nr:AMP-binding protein [Catenulispora pinistramenti]MBS2536200.1 AMP-binding protein [Catenulispora pinistramenti]MBS2545612.1 AMP-binding protein [Catenulispora pinistramenti]
MPATQSTETRDPVEFHWLGDIVRVNLDDNARGSVLAYGDQEWDWTEFDARVRKCVTGIRSDRLQRGQRVAVLARNHPVHVETLFAASNMGLVCTWLDWRLDRARLVHALNEAEARILFVGEEFVDLIDGAMMEIASVVSTITVGGREDEYEEWLETHETHEALLRAARELAAVSGDDPVLRLYSSTGKKGPTRGEYTHRALLASASETLRRKSLARGDVEALDAPVTVHEAAVRVLANMSAGAATVLVREE